MEAQREFYTSKEVFEKIEISRSKFYKLVHDIDDPLPAMKITSMLRIPIKSFNEWLERHPEIKRRNDKEC